MPLMTYGPGRRELVHGLTQERTLRAPELGIKPGVSVANFAVGFYNDVGGYTIGQVWKNPGAPNIDASQFAQGAMVFKILFSAATPDNFLDPASYILQGAPEWQIATGNGKLTTVRLLQMDVAARDDRAGKIGWVYGTFTFDRNAKDKVAWKRLRPVGLMWGNDPGYTPADQAAGKPLTETIISNEVPAYAKSHLGWAGRLNGPVDNPASACTSCHTTSQYPVDAPLLPSASCNTDAKKLLWFRNLSSSEAFGAVNASCLPEAKTPPAKPLNSLQMQVAVQSILQFHDVNPCIPAAAVAMAAPKTIRSTNAPRVGRDGFFGDKDHP
jgi:hypothetical protein